MVAVAIGDSTSEPRIGYSKDGGRSFMDHSGRLPSLKGRHADVHEGRSLLRQRLPEQLGALYRGTFYQGHDDR
jgi:hypothetical protein